MIYYYIDMDGFIAKWQTHCTEQDILNPGYFATIPVEPQFLQLVKRLIEDNNHVYILSSLIDRKPTIEAEKRIWLKTYLPELPPTHYLFVPEGISKARYKKERHPQANCSILLDDHGRNLEEWVKYPRHLAIETYGSNKKEAATGYRFPKIYFDQPVDDLIDAVYFQANQLKERMMSNNGH